MISDCVRLGDYIFDAGVFGFFPQLFADMHGKHDDLNGGSDAGDLSGGVEPIHDGHGKVEDDGVGVQFGDFLDGNLAIFGLAAYQPVGVVLDEKSKQMADGGAVVGDEDFEWHAKAPLCLGGLLAGSEAGKSRRRGKALAAP